MEPLGDWTTIAPWKSRHVLIIDAGNMLQAVTVSEKRTLLRAADPLDLIAAWSGQWSTTARRFAPGDAETVAASLG